MKELEEKFKNLHLMSREERLKFLKELEILRPDFMKDYLPKWYWWKRCKVKVLIVADGGLDFSTNGFGLSEFLTAFNQLQATTWNNYEITLGHRSTPGAASANPLVVAQINNFNFQTSVTLNDFDQVWLFGINTGSGLPAAELTVVEAYMNAGGGLFATGDHGALGSAMCSNITRVQDMRYWTDGTSDTTTSAESMSGPKRNDTNRPKAGDATSLYFDNQSDNIPQTIAVRTFGAGSPHPLLTISKTLRPSGIIDIMPDHPHEGECKIETTFTVNGVAVPTQIIATSFVLGGSTTNGGVNGKTPTIPHCFPSIAVWDGRLANCGRIAIDSTWHHFININLNGSGSQGSDLPGVQSGLDPADFVAIRQYYMNIALWISRRKTWPCWYRILWIELLKSSQLIEANLDNPKIKLEKISLHDLGSIGSLAEEILSTRFGQSIAREMLIEMLEVVSPEIATNLNVWKPKTKEHKANNYQAWLNLDLILHTAVGTGFIALRDDKNIGGENLSEEDLDRVLEVFSQGMAVGYNKAVESLHDNFAAFTKTAKIRNKK